MAKGTDPTPVQLRFRLDQHGHMNKESGTKQLREQDVSSADVLTFMETADRLRREAKVAGQMDVLNSAAEAIGAEVHWI